MSPAGLSSDSGEFLAVFYLSKLLSNYQKIDKMLTPTHHWHPLYQRLPAYQTAWLVEPQAARAHCRATWWTSVLYDTFNPERLGMQLNWLGTTNTCRNWSERRKQKRKEKKMWRSIFSRTQNYTEEVYRSTTVVINTNQYYSIHVPKYRCH
jgi:hypothetical protein